MKKYGLTGNPLGHSISPEIHSKLKEIKGLKSEYGMYSTADLDKTYKEKLSKLDGFNITVPYKQDIIKYLDVKSDEVELYNACNTVKFKNDKVYGYNTDTTGFNECFIKNQISFENKNVLVTGAGGVSSMMAIECLRQGANVYLTCRNKEKAEKLIAAAYEKTGKKIIYVKKEDVENIDILVQGTPLGMYPEYFNSYLPLNKLKNIPVVFDTIYNPVKTLTVRICEYYGNFYMNGLQMLVSQASKAQEIWENLLYNNEEISRVIDSVNHLIPEFRIDKNIILIGAPGSGKTTISREISKILDMNLEDIDKLIVGKEGRTINEIFSDSGEEYFRKAEREIFSSCTSSLGNVIATGGGLPEFNDLSLLDKEKNIVVFLDVDIEELKERVVKNNDRPLLKSDKKTAIENIVKRRYNMYNNCCDVKIKVEKGSNIKDTVVKVIEEIKKEVNKDEI